MIQSMRTQGATGLKLCSIVLEDPEKEAGGYCHKLAEASWLNRIPLGVL